MLFKEQLPNQSFLKWLLNGRENKFLLLTSIVIITIKFIWFKMDYPYPNFFPDSYDYIAGAIESRSISYRPIGYSKFLQIVHFFSSSHMLLVTVQYALLQLSILYLLFSISYLLAPGKWCFRIMFIGCTMNPLVLHLSNLISSDPIFTMLSLVWLAQLLWIIARPESGLLILHAIVLALAFTMRYNALYYPLVSFAIILFSQTSAKVKLSGIAFCLLLLGSFVIFTRLQFKKLTGEAQFAPFNGWITVVNALVVYYHADPLDAPWSMPPKFQQLHQLVNKYIDSLHRVKHVAAFETAPFFMWSEKSPLYLYWGSRLPLNYYFHPDFKQWATLAPFCQEYGTLLIKRHPELYLKYHLGKNLLAYNDTWLEYMGQYFAEYSSMGSEVRQWFQIKPFSTKIARPHLNAIAYVAIAHQIMTVLLMLFLFPAFITMKKTTNSSRQSKTLAWMIFIWWCNLGFTILASYPSFRYLAFQILLNFLLDMLLLEFVIKCIKLQKGQLNTTKSLSLPTNQSTVK